MRQKPKARQGPRKAKSKSGGEGEAASKTQSERFIETARSIGVDESGDEFERAIRKIVPTKTARRQ